MITAENVERFIEENSTSTVLKTLHAMTEEQRLGLKSVASRNAEIFRFREIKARPARTVGHPTVQDNHLQTVSDAAVHAEWQRTVEWYESAKVIMLYCCDFEELKSAGRSGLPSSDHAFAVLSQRKPRWLDKWCSYTLGSRPVEYWKTILRLESFCQRKLKHTASYYQALALGLSTCLDMEKLIEESPALLGDFYTFLNSSTTIRAMAAPSAVIRDIEFANFNHLGSYELPNLTGTNEWSKRWIQCISSLANQGKLDRERLVKISFETLANVAEVQKKRAASYMPPEPVAQFLCSLNDTLCPDKSAYLQKYASLIGATNADVSVYAIKVFLESSTTALPIEDILANIPMAFRNRDKAPAVSALKLLAMIDKASVESQEAVALAVIESFCHKSKAIHKDAITMLEKGNFCKSEIVQDKLRHSLDLLEGINRTAAAKLLATNATVASHTGLDERMHHEDGEPSDALDLKVPENLDRNFVSLSGIDDLCEASRTKSAFALAAAVLKPVNLASMDVPRLYADQKLDYIETVEDLIFLLSAALTKPPSAQNMELMLDGIARFWKSVNHEVDERNQSLRSALQQINPFTAAPYSSTPMGAFVNLWLSGTKADPDRIWFENTNLVSRCRSLWDRMRANLVLPMLATPTHKGGWIEPLSLVRRIKAYQDQQRLLDKSGFFNLPKSIQTVVQAFSKAENLYNDDAAEFVQALLRLAPDGRREALNEAASIKGTVGKALRYALGGGDISTIDQPAFAIAAFRSREPRGICPIFGDTSRQNLPDVIYPAKYTYNSDEIVKFMNDHYRIISPRIPDFLSVVSNGQSAFPLECKFENVTADGLASHDRINEELYQYHLYPTVLVHRNHRNIFQNGINDWSLDWLQNKEPLLARMAKIVLQHVNSIGNDWQNEFSVLFDPDFALDENGSWFFSLALTAKHDDFRRLALDILIAAVEENRANPEKIGEAIARLLEHKFTVVRWTKSFRELSRVSPLHALFSWQLLMSLLATAQGSCPVGFLELILELKEEYGFALSQETLSALEHFGGTGKIAKLAKSLAAEGVKWSRVAPLREAAQQSLSTRIARVERWQRSQYFNPS